MLKINCSKPKNLQKGACVWDPKLETMDILMPDSNNTITKANLADSATFKTFIDAQLHHDDEDKRWHIVGPFAGLDNQSEDVTVFTDEYGNKAVTDDIRYMHVFRLRNGLAAHVNLRTFNNQHEKYSLLRVSGKTIQLYIHADKDTDGNTQYTGAELNLLFAPAPTTADRSNPTFYKVMIGFADTTQVVDEVYAVDVDFNPLKLVGVQEVTLENIPQSPVVDGIFHVKATTNGGQTNLAEGALGTILAVADAWIVKDKATGAEITLTSVAKNGAEDAFIITMDTADTDYDDTGKAYIDLEPVGDLATLGAKYYANSERLEVTTT